jgi:hypothetical protein
MLDGDRLYDCKTLVIKEADLPFGRYAVSSGEHLDVDYVAARKIKGNGVLADWIDNALSLDIVSARLKALLEEYEIGNTQFIPIRLGDSAEAIGYLVNIVDPIDALDLESSVAFPVPSQNRVSVLKYALKKSVIGSRDLFCLTGHFPLFITERLRSRLLQEKITGRQYYKSKVS